MSKKIVPSPFQSAVYNFVEHGSGNAVINAVAGSGKTTTIVEAVKLVPQGASVIFLAFNKAIVEELVTKLPAYVKVCTTHSLGWSGVTRAFNRPKLNDKKVQDALKWFEPMWKDQDGEEAIDYDYLARVRKLVNLLRIDLVANPVELEKLAFKHDIDLYNGECTRAFEVANYIKRNTREFDFVDMLYVAATDARVKLQTYDFIFVDECQDLNKAQQALLTKIMHVNSRFIAVGDPRQAIYGFAGADVESFNNLKTRPNTIELPLSVNYRCGSTIIDLAKTYCEQLQAFEGAIAGTVDNNASIKAIEDGDMVLCRNTGPLVKCCLQFIGQGKKAYVKGGDMGASLVAFVKKAKKKTLPAIENYLDAQLDKIYAKIADKNPNWTEEDIKSENQYMIFAEKAQVIRVIMEDESVKDLASLVAKIEGIFADDKAGICFSSIHRSKGLENKRVFIIDSYLMPSKWAKKDWQKEQEKNLIYVAYTRAKEYLGFVTDWTAKVDKEKKGEKKEEPTAVNEG